MNISIFRPALVFIGLVCTLFAPLWCTIVIGIVLAAIWQAPEAIVLAAILDLLYVPPEGFWHIPMPLTIAAIALVWVLVPLRRRLFT